MLITTRRHVVLAGAAALAHAMIARVTTRRRRRPRPGPSIPG